MAPPSSSCNTCGCNRIEIAVDCGDNFVEKSLCRENRVVRYVAALKRAVNRPLASNEAADRSGIVTEDIQPSFHARNGSNIPGNSIDELPMKIALSRTNAP